jgi:hypothetical protein
MAKPTKKPITPKPEVAPQPKAPATIRRVPAPNY